MSTMTHNEANGAALATAAVVGEMLPGHAFIVLFRPLNPDEANWRMRMVSNLTQEDQVKFLKGALLYAERDLAKEKN